MSKERVHDFFNLELFMIFYVSLSNIYFFLYKNSNLMHNVDLMDKSQESENNVKLYKC